MADRIRLVRLRYFRGATAPNQIDLDAAKPFTLLFGENGTGKSSIVDGIDAVCNGQAGSLAERSSTTVRDHLPSAGRAAADVAVEVAAGAHTWRATLAGNTITTEPAYTGAPVYVLRRNRLLELVNAQPADRYAVIQGFVDVSGVERAERALGDAVKEAADGARQIEGALKQARAALDDLWAKDGRPGAPAQGAEAWAEAQTAVDLADLRARSDRAGALAASAGRVEEAARVHAAAVGRLAAGREARDAAARTVAAIEAGGHSTGVVQVLAEVQRLLTSPNETSPHEPTACPVCERPVVAADLRARVAARLTEARSLTEALRASQQAAKQHDEAATAEAAAHGGLVAAVRGLGALMNPERVEDEALRPHVVAVRGAADAATPPESVQALAAAAPDVYARARRLGDRTQQQIGKLDALRVALGQVHAKSDELADAQRLHARLREAQAVVREERVAFIQGVLDEVCDECNRLYEAIHPGEGIRLRRLWLDAKRRGSLHQEADFGAHAGVPPQAYFSESHLDTLGLCFWLAIKQREARGGPPPIVVLDDAFTSVDAAHGRRVLELLVAESERLTQLIVATHQRPWVEYLRQGAVPAGGVQVVELHPWHPERGIDASATQLRGDRGSGAREAAA